MAGIHTMQVPNLEAMIDKLIDRGAYYCPKCGIQWMHHYWSHIVYDEFTEYTNPVCPDLVNWKRENSESA